MTLYLSLRCGACCRPPSTSIHFAFCPRDSTTLCTRGFNSKPHTTAATANGFILRTLGKSCGTMGNLVTSEDFEETPGLVVVVHDPPSQPPSPLLERVPIPNLEHLQSVMQSVSSQQSAVSSQQFSQQSAVSHHIAPVAFPAQVPRWFSGLLLDAGV